MNTTLRTAVQRSVIGVVATTAISAGAWVGSAGPALADSTAPKDSGCPASYSLLSVADLTAQGYHAPQQIDDPANGGNGDGWVCGKPLSDSAAENFCGGPCSVPVVYRFRDDTVTPAH